MIITRVSGGIGNQMFQYAVGRAVALKQDVPLKLDNYMQKYLHEHQPAIKSIVFRDYELNQFAIQAEIAERKDIPWWLRFYNLGKIEPYIDGLRRRLIPYKGREKGSFQVFDPSIFSIGPNAYLDGNWQSYKYFADIAPILRKDFQLKHPPIQIIQSLADDITACQSVCLHVRRGDYVGNSFHGLKDQAYYNQALQKIKDIRSIDSIFVFSDDIEWCRNNLSFEYQTVFVGTEYAGEHAMGHFHLMRSCKHFIIGNSSFSWWAAWLADDENKVVVAPKQWFLDTSIDTSDLNPPEWLQV